MTITRKTLCAAGVIAALFLAAARPGVSQDGAGAPNPAPRPQIIGADEALTLVTTRAEQGDANAMLALGSMHERGIGTPRNYSKALEWYLKAGNAGLVEGLYNVGVCLETGMGTPVDMTKAFAYYESAANRDFAQARYKLAMMSLAGAGSGKNEARGMELLARAAEAGDSRAINHLGLISFEGGHGQPKDMNKAFDYFSKAAELGNAEAMKNLAVFHRDGIGRAVDPEQELKWYALARLAGFPAQTLNPAIESVKDKLTGEQVRKVESEAQAWLQAFRERNGQTQIPTPQPE